MITIEKSPYPCCFSKNGIEFRLRTDMQFPAQPVYPKLTITVNTGAPALGSSVSFSFTDPTTGDLQNILLIVNPGNFPGSLGTLPPFPAAAYAILMAEVCKKIARLNAWYNVDVSGTDIVFTAREAIAELIPISPVASNDDFSVSGDVAAYQPAQRDNYELTAVVYFEHAYGSDQFSEVARLSCVADDGVANIDVGGILDAETEISMKSFPMPDGTVKRWDVLRRYYIEFSEKWTGKADANKTVSDVAFVHWGGVSRDDEMMGNPVAQIVSTSQWLTWWPSGKRLFADQQDWLTWMNTTASTNFVAKLKVWSSAGVSTYTISTFALKKWESVVIPTGYKQRDIASLFPPGTGIKKWMVQVFDPDIPKPMTTDFFYYLDTQANCTRNQIFYYNSFGCAESMPVLNATEKMAITSDMAKRADTFSRERLFPQNFNFNSKHTNTIEGSTGRILKKEAFHLQAMLNAPAAFLWQDNERWIPTTVMTSEAVVKIESEFTTELTVTLMRASENDRASFMNVVPELVPIFSNGLFIGVQLAGITSYTSDDLYLVEEDTYVDFDSYTQSYTFSTPISQEGNYTANVQVYSPGGKTIPLIGYFSYRIQELTTLYNQIGVVKFSIASSLDDQVLKVDWGTGEEDFAYDTSISDCIYANTGGRKQLRVRKENFDDVIYWSSVNTNMSGIDFAKLENLQQLSLDNCGLTGGIFLSGNAFLRYITLKNMALSSISLGLQPDLSTLTIDHCSLSTQAIEDIIRELWSFRKFFSSPGTMEVGFSNYGPAIFSAEAIAMIDGTGQYTGEGLATDYEISFYY